MRSTLSGHNRHPISVEARDPRSAPRPQHLSAPSPRTSPQAGLRRPAPWLPAARWRCPKASRPSGMSCTCCRRPGHPTTCEARLGRRGRCPQGPMDRSWQPLRPSAGVAVPRPQRHTPRIHPPLRRARPPTLASAVTSTASSSPTSHTGKASISEGASAFSQGQRVRGSVGGESRPPDGARHCPPAKGRARALSPPSTSITSGSKKSITINYVSGK